MAGSSRLSTTLIRERLAGTGLAQDPTDVTFPESSKDWPPDVLERLQESLKPAGVLIPVIERDVGLTVLLTRRSAELKHHAGQISFPGGRMEDADVDIEVTALRETHEEVGIAPDAVSILGYLEAMPTITGYAVTPIVGHVAAGTELKIDTTEVEIAFEVPLSFLFDPGNARPTVREFWGRQLPILEFMYEGHRIWGATAHMLLQLRDKVL